MKNLSIKEKIAFKFIFNERRVYRHMYTRFIICGVNLDRIRRVVSRIKAWYDWCDEWDKEGEILEKKAENSLLKGNTYSAKSLFHEAAGCYHIGEHFFYINPQQKNKTQEKVRICYKKALELYNEDERRPSELNIPFRNTVIPGYLWETKKANSPLIIFINGMDNLKEVENHLWSSLLSEQGFNVYTFDGPGQGEMWQNMKYIKDYHKAVSTIIDWFTENKKNINCSKIATLGFSLGGYLAPRSAAYDKRICCAVGDGGPAYGKCFSDEKKVNPIFIKGFPYITGIKNYKKSIVALDFDIKTAPSLDRPLLIIHSGNDKLIPNGKLHADYFIDWAKGEKELKFYEDGDHVCANYFDEVFPYIVDWLKKYLYILSL